MQASLFPATPEVSGGHQIADGWEERATGANMRDFSYPWFRSSDPETLRWPLCGAEIASLSRAAKRRFSKDSNNQCKIK